MTDLDDLIPMLVVEFGLELVSDAVLQTLREILTKHARYEQLEVKWYPPESGKHSETWVTMVLEDGDVQYRIGSRGGRESF